MHCPNLLSCTVVRLQYEAKYLTALKYLPCSGGAVLCIRHLVEVQYCAPDPTATKY
jgi:hypothetical protein